MGTFDKVSAGQPEETSPAFKAAWLNAVSEATAAFHQRRGSATTGVGSRTSSTGMVKVRNLVLNDEEEGQDLERGHYVQLGAHLLTVDRHRNPWYEGKRYDADADGRIAILTTAIKGKDGETPGAIGPARTLGICMAKVNVTDVGHRFAAPDDGEYVLKSAASGEIEIISIEEISGTGVQDLQVLLGGGGGGVSTPVDIKIVLIDEDIPGVEFDNPLTQLTEADIELTDEEIGDGVTVLFQDPPSDDLEENVKESLNVFSYERTKLSLKYFVRPAKAVLLTGVVQDGTSTTIVLESDASEDDGEYNERKLIITSEAHGREVREISDYVGSTTLTVHVGEAFDHTPDDSGDFTYSIERWEPGYDEDEEGTPIATKMRLRTTVTDIGDDPPTRVVRYATTTVYYDEADDFEVGTYKRTDYPSYDSFAPWPPPDLPEGFLKKRYRGIAIDNVLIKRLCRLLPAPPLPE